ncbi:MAG: DUF2950 domain-containing protein [Planctomycetota bacterium]
MRHAIPAALAALLLVIPVACSSADDQLRFESPEAAIAASVDAVRADDEARLVAILGEDSSDLLHSGDPIADREARERFLANFDAKHEVAMIDADRAEVSIGERAWPFPIPIVRDDAGWRFDTEAGRETILARRIGRNELATIAVCRALVDAQMEYASVDRDDDGILEFAPRLRSTPGRRDGLYWETMEGEEPSPIGALVAEAAARGYTLDADAATPQPFNGYYFKMLREQGAHAAGGAYSYLAGEHMIGGFAVVAYPARPGDSGVMTFAVNQAGTVFEADLGADTAARVAEMTAFDPGPGWSAIAEDGAASR